MQNLLWSCRLHQALDSGGGGKRRQTGDANVSQAYERAEYTHVEGEEQFGVDRGRRPASTTRSSNGAGERLPAAHKLCDRGEQRARLHLRRVAGRALAEEFESRSRLFLKTRAACRRARDRRSHTVAHCRASLICANSASMCAANSSMRMRSGSAAAASSHSTRLRLSSSAQIDFCTSASSTANDATMAFEEHAVLLTVGRCVECRRVGRERLQLWKAIGSAQREEAKKRRAVAKAESADFV